MTATYDAPGAPHTSYPNPTNDELTRLILNAPAGAVIGVFSDSGGATFSATFNVIPGAYRVEARSHVKTFGPIDTAISVFLEQIELLS